MCIFRYLIFPALIFLVYVDSVMYVFMFLLKRATDFVMSVLKRATDLKTAPVNLNFQTPGSSCASIHLAVKTQLNSVERKFAAALLLSTQTASHLFPLEDQDFKDKSDHLSSLYLL